MRSLQIEAYARLKPINLQSQPISMQTKQQQQSELLEVYCSKQVRQQTVCNLKPSHQFNFKKIFGADSTQQDVYKSVAAPLVQDFLDGYNGTVFAYGQTGSGKTFTMSGGGNQWEQRGIIPRVFTNMFQIINQRKDLVQYQIYASYLEIYNECGYDLLERKHAETDFDKWAKITLFEDQQQNLHLKNLSIHAVQNEQDALNLLMTGNYIRKVSSTPMNKTSSRSHCIFTLALEGRDLGSDLVFTSKLHLVDLAGSERVHKSDPDTQIKNEAKYINRSLSYLEQVIIALYEREQGSREHVPFRNSMMTQILRDSLGGNCRTVMIANVSQAIENEDETVSTARFAIRCQKLVNQVSRNTRVDMDIAFLKLQQENEALKAKIIHQNGIVKQQNHLLKLQMSQGTIQQTPSSKIESSTRSVEQIRFMNRELSGDEVLQCEKIASKFIESEDFEIEIHNLNEVNEYFRIFKDEILRLKAKQNSQVLSEKRLCANTPQPVQDFKPMLTESSVTQVSQIGAGQVLYYDENSPSVLTLKSHQSQQSSLTFELPSSVMRQKKDINSDLPRFVHSRCSMTNDTQY